MWRYGLPADWVARWLGENDPRTRKEWEISEFGTDLCDLGRRLAERWGCDPLVVEAFRQMVTALQKC